jgi:hypothetical protein
MTWRVLEDVACDAAAGFLFPSERDALEQAGHQRVVPGVVDAAERSIVDYVFRELAGVLGGAVARDAVAWQQYAEGILDKGNQYAAGMRSNHLAVYPTPSRLRISSACGICSASQIASR